LVFGREIYFKKGGGREVVPKIKPDHSNDYAPELDTPEEYPAMLDFDKAIGKNPLFAELKSAYGNNLVYGMHWIIDCDNWYGYG
jgi:hypothetical protein